MKTSALYAVIIWAAVIIIISCKEKAAGITDDEYAVYQAVIDTLYVNSACFINDSTKPAEVVLTAATSWYGNMEGAENVMQNDLFQARIKNDSYAEIFPSIESLSDSADWQYNFRRINSAGCKIDTQRFRNSYNYKTLTRESFKNYFCEGREEGWADFYSDFPDSMGVLSFSRAAFNNNKNLCLLYFEHYKDSLEASGNYVFLVKHNRQWTIMEVITDWVS